MSGIPELIKIPQLLNHLSLFLLSCLSPAHALYGKSMFETSFPQRLAILVRAAFISTVFLPQLTEASPAQADEPVHLGKRLELFVDHLLVESMDGLAFRLHSPQPLPLPENPLPGPYTTVLKDGDRYRAYYRDHIPGYNGPTHDGNSGEITCYAESRDGHEWTFPDLGISEVASSRGRNVILIGNEPASHNFTPFIDQHPDAAPEARYKALGGTHPGGGLYAFQSEDGIHWRRIREEPVMTAEDFAFDSQNASFWSEAEGQYVCYFRTWETPHGHLRTISRSTSTDFLNWSDPVPLHPNRPGEHLYTNATHPYFRAPHIYISTPTRFFPDRGNSTDIAFMATRAGSTAYTRLFPEAFIRPGLDPERWGNRSNYLALNGVPTGPDEMSFWHKSGHRYVLRTDGFVSIHADTVPGTLTTRVVTFEGDVLEINYSTSAGGVLRVALLDEEGAEIPGFGLGDCPPIVGDAIRHRVKWLGGPSLGKLQGRPVRLHFSITEGDLYAFQFAPE